MFVILMIRMIIVWLSLVVIAMNVLNNANNIGFHAPIIL